MSFSIARSEDLEMVVITTRGVLTQEIRKDILQNIAGELQQSGHRRVLIDLLQTEFGQDEPVTEALNLIDYMKSLGFPTNTRMAFLATGAELHRSFFEIMAQSEGYALRYFSDRDLAETWLCQPLARSDTA